MINKIDILNIKKNRTPYCVATKKATETFRHGPKVELYIVTPCEFKIKI